MKLKYYSHVAIGLVALVIAFSVYGAWYAHVGNESAKAQSLAAEIKAKNVSTQKTQQSKSELEHALADEASIKGYFVNTQDIVPFLGDLQAEGHTYGATVEVVSVSAEPAKPHAVLVLALRITGTFDAVERMLGAVEYEPYDTVLSNVTLDTPGSQNHAAPVWTAAATIRVGTIDTSSTVPVPAKTSAASTTTP